MKIYVKNLIPKNINIDSFTKKITNYKDIYSNDGIFRIQNNNIYKLIPQDIPCEYFNYKNMDFILDKSNYIFRKTIYYIPYKHKVYNIQQIEYKLNTNLPVSLIVQYIYSKIIDIYFYTKENELYINLKNNIIEYLSFVN